MGPGSAVHRQKALRPRPGHELSQAPLHRRSGVRPLSDEAELLALAFGEFWDRLKWSVC